MASLIVASGASLVDASTKAIVSIENLSKTFAGRRVLDGVDLTVRAGEIHGLLGQNGSGKSTLIKVLAAYHEPDAGAQLRVNGRPVPLPLKAGVPRQLGFAFVHQDLGFLDAATVLENLRVARYVPHRVWRISWREERAAARRLIERFGIQARPDDELRQVPEVDRALLAIARALGDLETGRGELLVLDEPTAYLPRDGVVRVFDAVREVASGGVGVLFVSHRLDEVAQLTQTVTVLRDGRVVCRASTSTLDEGQMVEAILGFAIDELYPGAHESSGETVLAVQGLHGVGLDDVALDLRRGEIVGVTGLIGMGWERLPYVLFGAQRADGLLRLAGDEFELASLRPSAARRAGIALLPGNRGRDGGVQAASAAENVTLLTLGKYIRRGKLSYGAEKSGVLDVMDRFDVRPVAPQLSLGAFSGGNQQKLILGKWFETSPSIFLLHEPTQGVDVGARRQIFRHISGAASRGVAVLIASSEYEDLAHLCDRVLVFRDGRVRSELHGAALTHERILNECFRHGNETTPAAAVTANGERVASLGGPKDDEQAA